MLDHPLVQGLRELADKELFLFLGVQRVEVDYRDRVRGMGVASSDESASSDRFASSDGFVSSDRFASLIGSPLRCMGKRRSCQIAASLLRGQAVWGYPREFRYGKQATCADAEHFDLAQHFFALFGGDDPRDTCQQVFG